MVNDTISDLLTRIRNANLAGHDTVDVLNTKMNYRISELFKKKGILIQFQRHQRQETNFTNRVKIYWKRKAPCITNLKRLSSRVFVFILDLKISLVF
jgi:small subunit ribosomal protein S8